MNRVASWFTPGGGTAGLALWPVVAGAVVSAAVTALVMLAVLPPAVEAQVAQLTGSGLTVARSDGLTGVTAEVGPPGGGIIRVFGSDGKTLRLSLNSSGTATGPGPAANAGMNVYNVEGREAVRVGSHRAVDGYGLLLLDAQGNLRYRAVVDGEGNPFIEMFDAEGNVIWSAP